MLQAVAFNKSQKRISLVRHTAYDQLTHNSTSE